MLKGVMTLKEASVRWGVAITTLQCAMAGQKQFPPRFKETEANKSEGTWLVSEEGMKRLYGEELAKR